ncbi:hypothetical protein Tco_0043083 [Tanacetum coccineum]
MANESLSEDPYEEAARQLLEQAPHSPEYVPDPMELEDHVHVYIPEPEHSEDLVPAEDEAPTPPLPPSFLSLRIRPPHTRAAMAQMRATAPSTYHPLAAELIFPRLTRHYLLLLDLVVRLGRVLLLLLYQVDVPSRESSEFYSRHHDAQKDSAAVRAEIEVLEARVTVLETKVRRHEWQRQAADDFVVRHIMRTQALVAGARVDTLEGTGSSS